MNLPNTLTLARIFLVPLLVVVLLTRFEAERIFGMPRELLGAVIFGTAALTDWLDGYLARRRRQVTQLGQLMDPLADKLLITAALVSLVQMGMASAWMVAVILGRELAITVFRSLTYTRGVTIPASSLGKVKMVTQVVAILLLILGNQVWLFLAAGPGGAVAGAGDVALVRRGLLSPLRRRPGAFEAGPFRFPGSSGERRHRKEAHERRLRPPVGSVREIAGYWPSRSMATFSSSMRRLASARYSVAGNSETSRSNSGSASGPRPVVASESAR